ncbi:MAG: chromate transporter [Angelakisella sp.]
MKLLLTLFLTFAKIGSVTFGGGYAMLSILQREICENHKWVSDEEIMDYYAIGQCTPGIISVNTATFVGYKVAGFWGSIFATVGVVLPSVVIITVIAAFIQNFAELPLVRNAFVGIRAAVCVLVLSAVIKLWKSSIVDRATLIIFFAVFGLSIFTDVSPAIFVVLAGVAGILLQNRKAAKQ